MCFTHLRVRYRGNGNKDAKQARHPDEKLDSRPTSRSAHRPMPKICKRHAIEYQGQKSRQGQIKSRQGGRGRKTESRQGEKQRWTSQEEACRDSNKEVPSLTTTTRESPNTSST